MFSAGVKPIKSDGLLLPIQMYSNFMNFKLGAFLCKTSKSSVFNAVYLRVILSSDGALSILSSNAFVLLCAVSFDIQ